MDDVDDALHGLRNLIDLVPEAETYNELDVLLTVMKEQVDAIERTHTKELAEAQAARRPCDKDDRDAAWRLLLATAQVCVQRCQEAGYRMRQPALAE